MIDDGETDWKVFAISTSTDCTQTEIEQRIADTYDFLLKYKSYDLMENGGHAWNGDGPNTFYDRVAHDGTLISPEDFCSQKDRIWYNAAEAMDVLKYANVQWQK